MNAEVARGGALEQEPWRRAESGCDGVKLVAPGGQGAFGGEDASDAVESDRSRCGVGKLRRHGDFFVADIEHVGEGTKADGALPVEPSDRVTFDSQRAQPFARGRQRRSEAPANRRYNSRLEHMSL